MPHIWLLESEKMDVSFTIQLFYSGSEYAHWQLQGCFKRIKEELEQKKIKIIGVQIDIFLLS